jgi:MYXO-CTERM domain-containing protein
MIEPGLYRLSNRPGQARSEPGWGLRVDELLDISRGRDIFSFDLDHPDSSVYLKFDGSLMHIFGVAWGGVTTGNRVAEDPALTSLAILSLYYAAIGLPADGFHAVGGTIEWLDEGLLVDVFAEGTLTGRGGLVRCGPGHGEWGWVDHGAPGDTIHWKFTATKVDHAPGPGALAVVAAGLIVSRRRRRS